MIKRLSFTLLLTLLLVMMGACHEGSFHWITPEAPPVVVDEPDIVPEEEVGVEEPDPLPDPPCELIKGNISKDGRMLYHVPGMPNYDQVKINEEDGEMFFCTVEEAEAAGFTRAGN